MKDYQKHLDQYRDFPDKREQAELYLRKYWLDKQELKDVWLKKRKEVFTDPIIFPSSIFNDELDVIINKGGAVLPEEDFEPLKLCIQHTGDNYFIILEDYDEDNPPHTSGPPYRFKYPVGISWSEIMSGGSISYDVYVRPIRNYFVFGDSSQWGRYCGSDFEYPLLIFGVTSKYYNLFHGQFSNSDDDVKDLKEWLEFYKMPPNDIY
jgi:hypothetical protein